MQTNKAEKFHVHARRSLAVSGEPLHEARSLRASYVAGLIVELRNKLVHQVRAQKPVHGKGKNAAAKI